MRTLLLLTLIFYSQIGLGQSRPVFPLQISPTGRYLVDSNHVPFFYQAETPWLLSTNLSVADARKFLAIRKKQGFTAFQLQVLPFDPYNKANVYGRFPFGNADFSQPNEGFFAHADSILAMVEEEGMLAVINPVWMDCCNSGWENIIRLNGREKCRNYGRYLATRFKSRKNLAWIHGGDKDPFDLADHYREIAMGIKEVFPDAIQTYHASSGHSSTEVIPRVGNPWLNLSFTYTYFKNKHNVWVYLMGLGELPEVYEVNHREYAKIPAMPLVLGESQYEGEDTASCKPYTPAEIVRRQAYWSLLSGSCGHAYGSWNWKVTPRWAEVEKDTGANDMLHVKQLFESIPWYTLVPDQQSLLLKKGAGQYGSVNYATTAITPDKTCAVIYFPPSRQTQRIVELNMAFFPKPVSVSWFNPVDGKYTTLKQSTIPLKGKMELTTPESNGEAGNDWVLLIKAL